MALFGSKITDCELSDCPASPVILFAVGWLPLACSFPALSCEFASVDVSDVLGTVSFVCYGPLGEHNETLCYLFKVLFGDDFYMVPFMKRTLIITVDAPSQMKEMSISFIVLKLLQHRFNLTKTVRKYPIDPLLQRIGQEFHAGSVPNIKSHGDEDVGEDMFEHLGEGAVELNKNTFDVYAQQ